MPSESILLSGDARIQRMANCNLLVCHIHQLKLRLRFLMLLWVKLRSRGAPTRSLELILVLRLSVEKLTKTFITWVESVWIASDSHNMKFSGFCHDRIYLHACHDKFIHFNFLTKCCWMNQRKSNPFHNISNVCRAIWLIVFDPISCCSLSVSILIWFIAFFICLEWLRFRKTKIFSRYLINFDSRRKFRNKIIWIRKFAWCCSQVSKPIKSFSGCSLTYII